MKNIFLLSLLIFFSFNSFAHKHTHDDDYEVRYINESMQLNNQIQENLRNNSPWQSFLSNYPQWFTYFNEYNFKPHRAFGSPIILSNGHSSEERFLSFVNTNLNDFNIPQDIVLSRKTENDKYINLDFTQYYNNLEIIDSRLYAKLTLDNKLVAFGLDVFSDISLDVIPTISESMAIESASENIISSITKKSVEDDLKILPIPYNGKYNFHLVYVVRVSTQLSHGPANYICYVDANNGDLLMRMNTVLYEAPPQANIHVEGEVYSTHPFNPSSVENLINLRVQKGGGNYYTDSLGNVNVPGSGSATFSLEGLFAEVQTNGGIPSFNSQLSNANVSFDNSNSTIQERTAFYSVNKIHDHLKSVFPTFTGLDYALETNIDVQGSCNAYYDGTINFFAEGNGCNATAKIPDVVYHEYGHGINNYRYGSGMWNGGLNEGYADIWAISLTQSPVLGYGWDISDPSIYVRRYDQNRKVYPQDLVGEVHADGEIIAGAFWDTYLNLNDMQQMLNLFKYTFDGAPDGPNGTEGIIYTDVLVEVLFADDNDANLTNGTPNDIAIIQAFALHGITLLSNAVIAHSPVSLAPGNIDINISANISATYSWALSSANCFYRVNDNQNWNSLSMTSNGNNFTATIPAQTNGNIVAYYISLTDNYGFESGINPQESNIVPLKDANLPYFTMVGYELYNEEDFDFNVGFWQTGDPIDNATTGLWEIGAPIGSYDDPSSLSGIVQTATQHTQNGYACAFTGNASSINDGIGTNDVDGGHTTLYSPYYNLSSYINPAFTYWRWYTNNPSSGANPGADWWQVLITDDGVNWVYVENTISSDLSWRRNAFRVKDYVNLSSSVQLKFIASDSIRPGQNLDGGSLIEAAVDDLYLYESLGNGTNIEENISDGKMPKIIKVTDYLGREVNPKSKSLNINNLIYYFDDGSVKKKSIYSKL
ncbi:hypothetical protein OAJ32_00105 [bacterium]|nr:hypothetical protein [bacterium]